MIELKNLKKSYGSLVAVNDLNLTIWKWTCYALLWRNWAWKSTTIKMLVWLLSPDSWEILYDWVNISDKPEQIKNKFAYLPDIPYVYEKLTGIEFLNFIWKMYGIEKDVVYEKSLKFAKMFEIEDRLTMKTEEYSHWMRQKLLFSSALMVNPDYLILDEPMVWLDPQSQRLVKNILKDLSRNFEVTVFLSTHELSVAVEIADRIWIIHWGIIQEDIKNENISVATIEEKFLSITWNYESDYMEWIRTN